MYYFRAKYYNAGFQRFLSEDPTGFGAGATNLYRYNNNNPIVGNDPTGLGNEIVKVDISGTFPGIPPSGEGTPLTLNMQNSPFTETYYTSQLDTTSTYNSKYQGVQIAQVNGKYGNGASTEQYRQYYPAITRTTPRIETGNLREGWLHIEGRHITGTIQSGGPSDLFPQGTTRAMLEKIAVQAVKYGDRTSIPSLRIQTFQIGAKILGVRETVRVVVDSGDSNRVITMFPVSLP